MVADAVGAPVHPAEVSWRTDQADEICDGYAHPMSLTRADMITILAEADPVGLIASGAPRDEYAAEADAILALRGVPTLTEITGVFAVSFSDPGACTRETARWIAEEMVRRAGSGPATN